MAKSKSNTAKKATSTKKPTPSKKASSISINDWMKKNKSDIKVTQGDEVLYKGTFDKFDKSIIDK